MTCSGDTSICVGGMDIFQMVAGHLDRAGQRFLFDIGVKRVDHYSLGRTVHRSNYLHPFFDGVDKANLVTVEALVFQHHAGCHRVIGDFAQPLCTEFDLATTLVRGNQLPVAPLGALRADHVRRPHGGGKIDSRDQMVTGAKPGSWIVANERAVRRKSGTDA